MQYSSSTNSKNVREKVLDDAKWYCTNRLEQNASIAPRNGNPHVFNEYQVARIWWMFLQHPLHFLRENYVR